MEFKTPREKRLEDHIENCYRLLAHLRENRTIRCINCKRVTKIKNLALIIQQFWESCGSYGEKVAIDSDEYFIRCPKCEKENRYFYCMDERFQQEYTKIKQYRHYFSELVRRQPR